jgi:hypothetical protein
LSASGASDSPSRGFLAWSRNLGAGVLPSFPPSVVVQVKALACELPHRLQLPLSRLSLSIHASWPNQIEIYFSIVQRKVVTPNDFKSLNELEQRLLAFQQRYEETASPFQWTFTRKDLTTLLAKIENKRLASAA